MARTVVDMMEDEEWEDPIPAGVLPEDAEEPAEEEGFEALLKTPVPISPSAPESSQKKLDAVFESGPSASERLKAAHGKDKRRAALDSASDALYAAFARKPIQKISSTPSEADAVSKAYGVERLDKQDARQAGLDAQNAELIRARIAKLGQGKTAVDLGDRTVLEQMMRMEPGSLANVSDKTLQRITGLRISGDNRAAAEARFREGRAFTADQNEQTRSAMREEREYQHQAHKEDKLEKKVEGLGKDLEGTSSVKRAIEDIDAAIARNPTDIPGQGFWDSRKPELFDSADDSTVKQNLAQMVAKILKKQSGQGVTEAEYDRTLRSYGITPNSTPSSFKVGWSAMKADAVKAAKESEARYGDEAAQVYKQRGGVTSGDFAGSRPTLRAAPPIDTSIPVREPGQAAPAQAAPKVINGYRYTQQPDGTWTKKKVEAQ